MIRATTDHIFFLATEARYTRNVGAVVRVATDHIFFSHGGMVHTECFSICRIQDIRVINTAEYSSAKSAVSAGNSCHSPADLRS